MSTNSARATIRSVETITREVGRWSLDVAAGWEIGLLGKRRAAGRLYDRMPPEHFLEPKNGARLIDWLAGRDRAMDYRRYALARTVHFTGMRPDGPIIIKRKGWSVDRGVVLTRLEQQGCFGDVFVHYFERGNLARTVRCGI